MSNLAKALIGLAALAFMLAVVTHFAGPMGTQAEAYSRQCVCAGASLIARS